MSIYDCERSGMDFVVDEKNPLSGGLQAELFLFAKDSHRLDEPRSALHRQSDLREYLFGRELSLSKG